MQCQHFMVRRGPRIERGMGIDGNIDEGFNAVAKRTQIHARTEAFDYLCLFQRTDWGKA